MRPKTYLMLFLSWIGACTLSLSAVKSEEREFYETLDMLRYKQKVKYTIPYTNREGDKCKKTVKGWRGEKGKLIASITKTVKSKEHGKKSQKETIEMDIKNRIMTRELSGEIIDKHGNIITTIEEKETCMEEPPLPPGNIDENKREYALEQKKIDLQYGSLYVSDLLVWVKRNGVVSYRFSLDWKPRSNVFLSHEKKGAPWSYLFKIDLNDKDNNPIMTIEEGINGYGNSKDYVNEVLAMNDPDQIPKYFAGEVHVDNPSTLYNTKICTVDISLKEVSFFANQRKEVFDNVQHNRSKIEGGFAKGFLGSVIMGVISESVYICTHRKKKLLRRNKKRTL